MSTPPSVCVIRKFRTGDVTYIQDIISESTMDQVGNFFWSAVLSELLIQVSVVLMGISFVLLGIPFKFCLIAIPLAVVVLYMAIWLGHLVKVQELSSDIYNIETNYLNDPYTCFFVAEVYGKSGEAEVMALLNKVKKVDYDFYNEKEFEVHNLNVCGLSKTVVGCIAVTRSLNNSKRAWIRRMAVKKEYRRRHIANHLLLEAIKFCEERNYNGIELITTTCHTEARNLYTQEGFEIVRTSFKNYYGVGASQDIFHMYRPTNQTKESKDISQEESIQE